MGAARVAMGIAVVVIALCWGGTLGLSSAGVPLDRKPHPPTRVEVTSPDGRFTFAAFSPNNWKSKHAVGELYEVIAGKRKLMWRRDLPQEFGPRFILMGPRGHVLLLDEGINVMSGHAIMILSPTNQLVAQHGFEDVQRVLQVPSAEIVRRARYGAWMASYPLLNYAGDAALVEAGGKTLTIRLKDGYLSVSD